MKLLRSMTGASQETRLVFLTWACVLGNNFQHGKMDVLAAALQVSKRHLDVALEYLVREGYLWKIKSSVKPMMGEKRGGRFDYGITSKAWGMWLELLSACCWKEELHLILIRRYAVGKVKTEKPTHFTAKMRLVWIALMLSSNKAGYVLAIEDSFFSKLLGMTEAQIRRTVRALVRVGVVSVVAAKLARTTLLGPMTAVYKVHHQASQWKIIRVGITRNDMEFEPIRLLRSLNSYEQRATERMRSKNGKLPIQESLLLDEQYFRLSKHFRNRKLKALVQQNCLAIVFSHVSDRLATRLSGTSQPHGRQNSLFESCRVTLTVVNQPANYPDRDLFNRVSFELSNSLSCGDVVSFEKMEREERGPNKITENEIFLAFIINELTNDIVNLIQILSKELQVFVDCFGGKLRVLNYLKHHSMSASQSAKEESQQKKREIVPKEQSFNFYAQCVLEVLVPNEEKYSDCLIYAGDLYRANSVVKHS
ncbi:hypothetical protein I6M56_07450 [Shewanella algae]|uniref:hypothetical protein n=1 Tax=Shewanella algae TaxID=38313 RepID=UPI001AAD949F|nr:hypothetical protein [Shewanella algae]MBO2678704.1 hypothetical protein [Shewanella algae]